jgi:hypothetical protein
MPGHNHYPLQIEIPKLLSIYLAPFFGCTNKTPHQIKTPKLDYFIYSTKLVTVVFK